MGWPDRKPEGASGLASQVLDRPDFDPGDDAPGCDLRDSGGSNWRTTNLKKNRLACTLVTAAGLLPLGGCEPYNGPQIPPTKGGAEARNEVEYPLGLPKTKAKASPSASKKAAASTATNPAPVH
jgi:hypothetical protein